ncbi:MAG: endonuclease III [Desulfurellaceae bacterium]|nr:endonuclease III [Desulfurellaceae bacterium]
MKQQIVKKILEHYKNPGVELNFSTPFELLIAAMLSARYTDKKTNIITKRLFSVLHSPQDFVNAGEEKIKEYISSVSMYETKAKYIYGMCKILVSEYDGEVPKSCEELIRLPGVGRKTANMVLSCAFNIPAISVDTHVVRVAQRLSLSQQKKPEKIEEDLMHICPKEKWKDLYLGMILLGRYICKARGTLCEKCFLKDVCIWRKNEI